MAERRQTKGKLRNKVFLVIMLVSVIPILVAGLLSVYSIQASHKTDVANLEGALIDQKYGEISNFVSNVANTIRVKVASDKTDESDFRIETQKFFAKQFFTQLPELQAVSFVGLDGKEEFGASKSDPEGVANSDLKDFSGSPELENAKSGKNYFGPVRFVSDGPVMTIAGPNVNNNGTPISMVVGVMNLSKLQGIVGETKLGNTGYLYLVDGQGNLIGGWLGMSSSTDLKNIGIVPEVARGQNFLGTDGQQRYVNYSGEEVVAAGRYIPEYGWGLIAEWPAKEADAGVNDILYKNLIVSVLVLLIVILASVVLSALIVRPIKKLEKGTELIAQGKFEEGVDIRTGDELEELGSAFNKMIAGLKQLEELKDEFVFIAAHELRTPVAAMKGYLSLILQGITGPINDKTKDFIEKVINSNQRLIQLVNDLLEVSRSEAGKLTIKVSPVDIVEPIDTVMNELKPLADNKSIQLDYEISQNLPKVMADPDRLKEVITNLVGNSIKYNNNGGWVRVNHELGGGRLITHVADNGFGIGKDAQAKLFEKFYRVQTDKTKDITGTGLGLFIVKEIIEKMGGKIWAESEGEGKGSTFSFSLPVA